MKPEKFIAKATEIGKGKYGFVPHSSPIVGQSGTKGFVPSSAPSTQTAPAPAPTTKK